MSRMGENRLSADPVENLVGQLIVLRGVSHATDADESAALTSKAANVWDASAFEYLKPANTVTGLRLVLR